MSTTVDLSVLGDRRRLTAPQTKEISSKLDQFPPLPSKVWNKNFGQNPQNFVPPNQILPGLVPVSKAMENPKPTYMPTLQPIVVPETQGSDYNPNLMKSKMENLWYPSLKRKMRCWLKRNIKIGAYDMHHVFLDFDNIEDHLNVLSRNFIHLGGLNIMKIMKWSTTFKLNSDHSLAPVWVNLLDLKWHLFEWDAICRILEPIGAPLLLDKATLTKTRPTIAKVRVEIDLTKLLIDEVILEITNRDGLTEMINQIIEYETIPTFCSHRKMQGHRDENCRKLHPNLQTNEAENTLSEQKTMQATTNVEVTTDTTNLLDSTTQNTNESPDEINEEQEWQTMTNRKGKYINKSNSNGKISQTNQDRGTSSSLISKMRVSSISSEIVNLCLSEPTNNGTEDMEVTTHNETIPAEMNCSRSNILRTPTKRKEKEVERNERKAQHLQIIKNNTMKVKHNKETMYLEVKSPPPDTVFDNKDFVSVEIQQLNSSTAPFFGLNQNLLENITGRKAKEKEKLSLPDDPRSRNKVPQGEFITSTHNESHEDSTFKDCEEDLYMINVEEEYSTALSDDEAIRGDRPSLTCVVVDLSNQGHWNWNALNPQPPDHIKHIITKFNINLANNLDDIPLWTAAESGKFSISSAWKLLRKRRRFARIDAKIWHKHSLTELWELLITDIKPHELNVESDVYAPSRGPNIPCQRPTDRGSIDGPCWSTVVCVRGWVGEVSIHGHRPRTVWRTTDHQHGPWSDLRLLKLMEIQLEDTIHTTVKWSRPSHHSMKLNTGGSCIGESSGGGGVVRDSNGNCIMAFILPLGNGTSNIAEPKAFLSGLKWCIANEHIFTTVETDSLLLLNSILNLWSTPWRMRETVEEIRELILIHNNQINHCYREANRVTDKLASYSHLTNTTIVITDTFGLPAHVKGLLNLDKWQFPSFRVKKRKPSLIYYDPP
ncbi:hypothetical protein KY289_025562 [Solanum tuberosum]|nr:hypothetical protein KY289_025562 [Solanum tuberosum]